MRIKKKKLNKVFTIFLFAHLIIWTLAPSLSNNNLPLDTIEALAWGSDMSWGFNKHPPLSAFFPEIFYQIFGNNDWAYYFLSQIFVVFSFFVVWIFSKEFFKNQTYSLISVLLLEGIYFYNFTTPEFNVNVCQLPFWALSVFFCWRGFKSNKINDWLLFGFFSALGVLSKYLFIYLLLGIDIFFIYLLIKNKIDYKFLVSLIPFFLILFPHLIWLTENNYITITYGINRTGLSDLSFVNHLQQPLLFLLKQIGILIPFFIMLLLIVRKHKIKFNFKDKKLLFLTTINIVPIFFIFLTSMIMGIKIRTMWMTPFYLYAGVLFVYFFQHKIKLNRLKYFFRVFIILFILSPLTYLYISITQTDKRTDYPGKKIAEQVNIKYKENFEGQIMWIVGDEWHGGNLSYHLKSRPKWFHILDEKLSEMDKSSAGNILTIGITKLETSKKFSEICRKSGGKFFIIENVNFCMNGIQKS